MMDNAQTILTLMDNIQTILTLMDDVQIILTFHVNVQIHDILFICGFISFETIFKCLDFSQINKINR